MKTTLRWLVGLFLVLCAFGAQAAITCTSLVGSDYSTNYINNTTTGTQTSFTITCNRTATADATTLYYFVTADNGNWATGNNNNARRAAGATIRYDVYTTGCGGTQWTGNTNISGTIVWPAAQLGTMTGTQTFWTCITTAQNPTTAGAYTDTITLTAVTFGTGFAQITGTHDITIYAPASCVINPAAGNVTMTYPAFSAAAVTRNTTFGVRCTVGMPYTLAVAPATGTLAGVNYTATLGTNASNGTGAVQTQTVTITAPAGQAGTCAGASCTATQTHTLTITY